MHLLLRLPGTRDISYSDCCRDAAKKHPRFQVLYALSDLEEGKSWDGPTGFMHLRVEREYVSEKKRRIFLSGPPSVDRGSDARTAREEDPDRGGDLL
ncbi:MAG: hypothetical protein ACUVYA_20085 [Planctomycetota bacterium]